MRGRRVVDSTGDTIVEVLIAIAVVGAVLGGAFSATRRSLAGARISQERGEAVKLVEGQVESLKAALNSGKADEVFTASGEFCLNDSLEVKQASDDACKKGTDNRYSLKISSTDIGTDGKTFTASARWDKFGGGEEERVDIVYRAYK